jgi:sialidase-1
MKWGIMSLQAAALAAVMAAGGATAPESPRRQEVFVAGQDGYHTYRIPSLIVTPHGTLLAFCEGRKNSRSDTGDIDLLSRGRTRAGW